MPSTTASTAAKARRRKAAAERSAAAKLAAVVNDAVEDDEQPAASVTIDPPTRRNLTAKVRNQITEMHDEGKSVKEIALATGISEERVQTKLDEAAAVTPAASDKPAKKTPVFTRLPGFENAEGKVTGMCLFAVKDGSMLFLGKYGETNDTPPAVAAYEATEGATKHDEYVSVPARFAWVYTPKR